MQAQVFQHVSFEGLGSIEHWLTAHQYVIHYTRFFNNDPIPSIDDVDFLIVMGGPMSVNDEDQFRWLIPEKKFICQMISRGKPVLGVCLGAQLLANALGAKVFPNSEKEIGWLPIHPTLQTNHKKYFQFPHECIAFHWHGETFDLPENTIRLAESVGCKNQAFQFGSNVIGLQFHMEMTQAIVHAIVTHCRHDLVPRTYIQSEKEILNAPQVFYDVTNTTMADLLQFLTSNS